MNKSKFDQIYERFFGKQLHEERQAVERLSNNCANPAVHKHEILEIEKRIDAKIAEVRPEIERVFADAMVLAECRDKRIAEREKKFNRHASIVIAALRDAGRGATAEVIRHEIWPELPWGGDRRS